MIEVKEINSSQLKKSISTQKNQLINLISIGNLRDMYLMRSNEERKSSSITRNTEKFTKNLRNF